MLLMGPRQALLSLGLASRNLLDVGKKPAMRGLPIFSSVKWGGDVS